MSDTSPGAHARGGVRFAPHLTSRPSLRPSLRPFCAPIPPCSLCSGSTARLRGTGESRCAPVSPGEAAETQRGAQKGAEGRKTGWQEGQEEPRGPQTARRARARSQFSLNSHRVPTCVVSLSHSQCSFRTTLQVSALCRHVYTWLANWPCGLPATYRQVDVDNAASASGGSTRLLCTSPLHCGRSADGRSRLPESNRNAPSLLSASFG